MPTPIGNELAWWCPSLDSVGNGTSALYDLVGSANGTLTNMDASTDWVADTASGGVRYLDFDGTNDFIDYGATLGLAGLSSFSFGCWVHKTAATEIYPLIRYNTNTAIGSNRRADYFGVEPVTGTLRPICYFSVAGTPSSFQQYTTSSLSVPLNTWTYVGFSINLATNTGRIFVNGSAVAATRTSGGTPPTALAANGTVTWKSQTYTGSSGTAFYFNGRLDGWRPFSTYLSDASHLALSTSRAYQPGRVRRKVSDGLFNRGLFNAGLSR